MCVNKYMCVQVAKMTRRWCQNPGAGLIGNHEPPDLSSRN